MAWTEEQLQAMQKGGGNLLVAAGAGSGKTAVLIERVLGIITDCEEPVDVDNLLIVTFTGAAAAEMRSRLARALRRLGQEQPENPLIPRQLVLLQRAHIMTIHSFCLELLKEHGYLLGLDAKMRVGGEGELAMLQERVLDEVFEAAYADDASGLKQLLRHYSRGIGDDNLRALVLKMIDFGQSMPDVEQWLNSLTEPYHGAPQKWLDYYREELRVECAEQAVVYKQAYKLAHGYNIAKYIPLVSEEYGLLTELAAAAQNGPFDDVIALLRNLEFKRMPAITAKDNVDSAAKEKIQAVRTQVKKNLTELLRQYERYFANTGGDGYSLSAELAAISPLADALVALARQYYQAWQAAKRRARLWEFADLEHYALELLQNEDLGVAAELRSRFYEVLVDEYQDVNQVQETLLAAVSRTDNRFMVGDIKQSIYRFRLAEPDIFMQKFAAYGKQEDGRRIDLNRNFRSQPGVLAGVNFIFERLMDGGRSEIVYDEAARLFPARTDLAELPCELLIIDKKAVAGAADVPMAADDNAGEDNAEETAEAEFADMQNSELEGRLLAERLQAEHAAGRAWGDMVILLRSYSSAAPVISRELSAAGIPCATDSQAEFIRLPEVQQVLNLLTVLDNPLQDIPLAALLHSPLVGLKLAELADLRQLAAGEGQSLFAGLRGTHRPELLAFLSRLDDWRQKSRELGAYELLEYIFNQTALPELIGSLPGGGLRRHNLDEILRLAREYDESGGLGLARFLRYLKAAGKKAAAADKQEHADAVRLMSIHKSKGLEFPVVFVAGMGGMLNESDFRQDILLHKNMGLGMRRVEPDKRRKYPTFGFDIIMRRARWESIAEELRILYVAMTRAEQKLVLVSTADIARLAARLSLIGDSGVIPPGYKLKNRSFLAWTAAALMNHPDGGVLRGLAGAEDLLPAEDEGCWRIEIIQSLPSLAAMQKTEGFSLADWLNAEDLSLPQKEIAAALRREYPAADLQRLPVKWSATAFERLEAAALQTEEEQAEPPADMQDIGDEFAEDLAAGQHTDPAWYAAYGSLIHSLLEKLDLSALRRGEKAEDLLAAVLSAVAAEYPADVVLAVDCGQLARVFDTDLGRRLLAAAEGEAPVLREQRFIAALSLAELAELDEQAWRRLAEATEIDLRQAADEELFFQGVIDLAFYDKQLGGWVLVDYKSGGNRGLGDEAVAAKYQWQLKLYRQALSSALKQPVAEGYIMFTAFARAVKIF